jgi:hypothetical protein
MLRRYLWETGKMVILLVIASPLICCAAFTLALVLPPHQRESSFGVELSLVVAQTLFILWIIRAVVRQLDGLDGRMLPAATKIPQGIAAELNKLNWFRSRDAARPASTWLKWSITGKVVAIEGDGTWHRDLTYAARRVDQNSDAN